VLAEGAGLRLAGIMNDAVVDCTGQQVKEGTGEVLRAEEEMERRRWGRKKEKEMEKEEEEKEE
jgi:hypothetical protein